MSNNKLIKQITATIDKGQTLIIKRDEKNNVFISIKHSGISCKTNYSDINMNSELADNTMSSIIESLSDKVK